MDSIKKIIPQVVENITQNRSDPKDNFERLWEKILTDKEIRHTQIFGVKDGELLVYVDSPTFMFRINMKKQKLLEELKKERVEYIHNITFKIGKIT